MAKQISVLPQADQSRSIRVFISYSRKDAVSAERLRDHLIARNFEAYIDQRDILPGEAWQERLAALISSADTVVFLISPDSIESPICDWEVNEAERLSKRILPVIVRDPPVGKIPGRLRRLNYIFLRDPNEEETALDKLTTGLLTNIDWIREHTRLGELASEWRNRGQKAEFLLRASALDAAELWLSRDHVQGQVPTKLHTLFIHESRQHAQAQLAHERLAVERTSRFQKVAAWGLSGVALLVILGGLGLLRWDIQATQREQAMLASRVAEALSEDRQDFQRAMRFAIAGTPAPGSMPWTPRSRMLDAALVGAIRMNRLQRVFRVDQKPRGVAFGPNGKQLLTTSFNEEGTVLHVWDITSTAAKPRLTLLGHPKGRGLVSRISPDGTRILSGTNDAHVILWNADTGEQIKVVDDYFRGEDGFSFSPDGTRAVVSMRSGQTLVLSASDGHLISTLDAGSPQKSALYSPDGSRIITTHENREVVVWDTATGTQLLQFKSPRSDLQTAIVTAANNRAVTISLDQGVDLWDLGTGQIKASLAVGERAAAWPIAVSKSGLLIASRLAGNDELALWSGEDGTLLRVIKGHRGIVTDVTFSDDEQLLLSTSTDGTAKVWQAASGTEIATLAGHSGSVWRGTFNSSGETVATSGDDGSFRVWNIWFDDSIIYRHPEELSEVDVSPDGHSFLIRDKTEKLYLWNSKSQGAATEIKLPSRPYRSIFSRDGSTILVKTGDGYARMFDADGKPRTTVKASSNWQEAASLSANGKLFASSDNDHAYVYSVETGERILELPALSTNHIALSSSGKALAVASYDGHVIITEVVGGKRVCEIQLSRDSIGPITFSPDGTRLLTTSYDGFAVVWNVVTCNEMRRISMPFVRGAVFSADGERLFIYSHNKVSVVDVLSGFEFAYYGTPAVDISRVLPAGNYLFQYSESFKSIHAWNIAGLLSEDPSELFNFVCSSGMCILDVLIRFYNSCRVNLNRATPFCVT